MKPIEFLFLITVFSAAHCGHVFARHASRHGGRRIITKGSPHPGHSVAAKQTLSNRADYIAASSQAVYRAKHALLHNWERQRYEAQQTLDEERTQLHTAKDVAASTADTAQQAAKQVDEIQSALQSAQVLMKQAQESASYAVSEEVAQTTAVTKAEAKLHGIEEELKAQRADFSAVKEAADKAVELAHSAQENVAINEPHLEPSDDYNIAYQHEQV